MSVVLLQTRIDGRVGVLTFNRPDALNAFNAALIDEVGRARRLIWLIRGDFAA
jgi:enoyl-CoA hydratase/carnithine racemase